jgi:hypothetical protein
VEHHHRLRPPGQPQVHRAHGLRPPPLRRSAPVPHRAPRPVDLDPRTGPPGDHHPRRLGHRPGHRRRARQQPRRARDRLASGGPPLLRAALTVPVPGLQTPHDRATRPPLRRAPRIHLLRLPAQPVQPPPHRRRPRPPPHGPRPRRRPPGRDPPVLRHPPPPPRWPDWPIRHNTTECRGCHNDDKRRGPAAVSAVSTAPAVPPDPAARPAVVVPAGGWARTAVNPGRWPAGAGIAAGR